MPDLSLEEELTKSGEARVAGIDEAGRGPLAGPVAVAAGTLPADYENEYRDGCKKCTEGRRELPYEERTTDELVCWALS